MSVYKILGAAGWMFFLWIRFSLWTGLLHADRIEGDSSLRNRSGRGDHPCGYRRTPPADRDDEKEEM